MTAVAALAADSLAEGSNGATTATAVAASAAGKMANGMPVVSEKAL